MIWPFNRKKREPCDEMLEAQAANIEAQLDLNVARQRYLEITQQTDQLEQINQRNHFSESLTRAFTREAPS